MKTIISSIALALTIGIGTISPPVHGHSAASAHSVSKQAPGYYRWTLGDFTITALSDGTFDLPVDQLLHGPKPGEVAAAFKRAFAKLPMEMSVNAFLIDTGSKLILIDAGGGKWYGPALGRVRESLIAAGYQPEQVNLVLLTHLHGDHSGGLLVDGKRAFPNAKVRAPKADFDYYLDPANRKAATDLEKVNFAAAETVSAAYRAAGRLAPFIGATEIAPGVRALPAPGHSPSHAVYMAESKGETLMLVGDLLHVPQIQFAHPEDSMAFDFDESEADTSRKTFLKEAAAHRYWIAGAHLPFPGIGHVRPESSGYVYVPAEYTANR